MDVHFQTIFDTKSLKWLQWEFDHVLYQDNWEYLMDVFQKSFVGKCQKRVWNMQKKYFCISFWFYVFCWVVVFFLKLILSMLVLCFPRELILILIFWIWFWIVNAEVVFLWFAFDTFFPVMPFQFIWATDTTPDVSIPLYLHIMTLQPFFIKTKSENGQFLNRKWRKLMWFINSKLPQRGEWKIERQTVRDRVEKETKMTVVTRKTDERIG